METRFADVVRSLAFYAIFYPGSAIMVFLALPFAALGGRQIWLLAHSWSAFHRFCCRWLLGIRVEVNGQFPEDGVLVAMRHESFFEAIDLPLLMAWPTPFPKSELLKIPGWGWALGRYGVVAVERAGGAASLRRMIATSRGFAAKGRQLVIFPEGTRMPTGVTAQLRSGFAGTYKMLGLPVVPVAVDSGQLYHRVWKKAGTITYTLGERIEPGLSRAEIEARVTAAITTHHT
ncbi:1-acyl-sn-glycerol-3-phosphate acyltransferase [Novosphingobium sp. BW1]|uniref:lysophospholipid acyltransferase family protein n=1 Tax=Novosphingobium sp. BW1 TaxID=2592621 RepID=UPI0011DE64C6|nr:lysophospholipid acyltransferase family protein [Novosphingobium sp. BW1]TYC91532.1 1-acyl-sn-glycerol-3-phosphate acyltransferase [Novosphingobium sp. BW1]